MIRSTAHPPTRVHPTRAGFSLIEVMVVVTILVLALGMFAGSVVSLSKIGPVTRESALAMDVARGRIDELHSVPFGEVFIRFNADPADDPGGAGAAPGAAFAVAGLDPQDADPDGFVGRIEFPTIGAELREDSTDAELGMPRDLNGDGAIDSLDHSGDYVILPIRVRLQWRGKSGERDLDVYTALAVD